MNPEAKKLRRAMVPALAALAALGTGAWGRPKQAGKPESRRLVEEKTGTLTSREGLRLRLVTDLGSVRIFTRNSNQVSYKVRIESDARDPEAQKLLKQFALAARNTPAGVQLTGQLGSRDFRGRLWVSFEIIVPRNYNLDVLTQAGSIDTQDIAGQVALVTSGGNITVGRVGGPGAAKARLETQGGHISVQEMTGELHAVTAAGHINVADMRGDAVLRSGGGHIRIGTIQGTAGLETSGGNISVARADGNVTAATGGGQIDFGQATGSVRARTGGGGIRILRVSGPIQLETGDGSIFLTKVQGAVRATTGAGGITAWFASDGLAEAPGKPKVHKFSGASQLESGQGDIVVYLPRELAVTIEALVETAAEHRIEADPDLPLKVSYVNSSGGRAVRGECALNGGGEILRLKTAAGNIRLKLSDTALQMRVNQQQMDELRRHMEMQQQRLLEWQRRQEQLQRQIERRVEQRAQELQERTEQRAAGPDADGREGWGRKLEQLWLGGIRVDPDEQQKKLVHSVQPVYPDVAKQAGMEGTVRLKVSVAQDGTVKGVKILSGEAVLANAAREAVQQWRYQPTVIEGKPVNVITIVTVEFRLK